MPVEKLQKISNVIFVVNLSGSQMSAINVIIFIVRLASSNGLIKENKNVHFAEQLSLLNL